MKISYNDLNKIKNYQQEKGKFYLLDLISKTEGSKLSSDLDKYIIGRSRVGLPIWIWTDVNITNEKMHELRQDLEDFLVEGDNQFTTKKELYELLKRDYNTSNYFEMGYLTCEKLIDPKIERGKCLHPTYGDVLTLAKMWKDNEKEMEKIDITDEEAIETAKEWIAGNNFYVLKDESRKIVCMAGYSKIGTNAKITHVFTPKEERRKGYCKKLIYELTKILLENNLKPLLYTDYNYKASNAAYKSVGYTDEGILINFTISK